MTASWVRAYTSEATAASAATFRGDTPDGSFSEKSIDGAAFDAVSGAGDDAVTVTQVAAGLTTTLFGALAGLHPVESVDDLDRRTG